MSWTGVRTVAVLELRQRVRATRWRVMLLIWGVVLMLLSGGLAAVAAVSGSAAEDTAPVLYDLVLCFVLGIGLVVAPTLSATSINGDRADATLALLQATALKSQEIVVGKLVAAWFAALAFLAVASPFLLTFMVLQGATPLAFLGHLLVLTVTLGAVCAVGLGFSAMTARSSASAVLTYLVVTALTIGTPLVTTISTTFVRDTQTRFVYEIDYDTSSSLAQTCKDTPTVHTVEIYRTERIWWMLAPNPFVALSDISARAPVEYQQDDYYYRYPSMLASIGKGVDAMRTPQPEETTDKYCDEPTYDWDDERQDDLPQHLPFWPASLLFLAILGVGGVVTATRRLATPAGGLPRGVRLA